MNPTTPVVNLETLSKDSEWGVRRAVSANSASSQELLENLASDSIREVQVAVAGNPKTAMPVLEHLWSSAPDTRGVVIENPTCTENFLKSAYQAALLPTDGEDNDSDDDIRGDTNIRGSIAKRANLSNDFLKILVQDPSHYVRRDLANNLLLTDEFLAVLALDTNEDVRESVVNNPNSSPESKATATLLGLPEKEDSNE
jgi:hypothetical protein